MDDRDQDRLELLDRIADRCPEIDLDRHRVEWTTLPDGGEVLLVDGWGGGYFANHGDGLHAYGSLDPIVPGYVGCIVIHPDGTASSSTRWRTRWRSSRTDARPRTSPDHEARLRRVEDRSAGDRLGSVSMCIAGLVAGRVRRQVR